jgi:hypothetical protein
MGDMARIAVVGYIIRHHAGAISLNNIGPEISLAGAQG